MKGIHSFPVIPGTFFTPGTALDTEDIAENKQTEVTVY